MVKSVSISADVRERLRSYGFDWQLQENMATQVAFKLQAFAKDTVFVVAQCGVGFFFDIVNSTIVDFRLVNNPREFDAEGCQER